MKIEEVGIVRDVAGQVTEVRFVAPREPGKIGKKVLLIDARLLPFFSQIDEGRTVEYFKLSETIEIEE